MKPCPSCGKPVHARKTVCPHCQAPIPRKSPDKPRQPRKTQGGDWRKALELRRQELEDQIDAIDKLLLPF